MKGLAKLYISRCSIYPGKTGDFAENIMSRGENGRRRYCISNALLPGIRMRHAYVGSQKYQPAAHPPRILKREGAVLA